MTDWMLTMKHGRANNKQIRMLMSYVIDDLKGIDEELHTASRKHFKPRKDRIDSYASHIESLMKGIKCELKFEKRTEK